MVKTIVDTLAKSWIYLKRYPGLVTEIVIFSIIGSGLESFSVGALIPFLQLVLTPGTSLHYLDFLIRFLQIPSASLSTWLVAGFLTLFISRSVVQYWNIVTVNELTNLVRRDLQAELFNALGDAQLAFFTHRRTGDLVSNVSTYTDNISQSVFALLQMGVIGFRCLAYIALLFFLSWKITLLIALVSIIIIPATAVLLRRLSHVGAAIAEHVSAINVHLFDLLRGIPLMKIFGTEKIMQQQFKKSATDLMNASLQATRYYSLVTPASEILFAGGMVGLGLVGLRLGHERISAYLPYALPYVFTLFQGYAQGSNFLNNVTRLAQNSAPLRAYETVYQEALAARLPVQATTVATFEKSVSFEQVSFSYQATEPILSNVSIVIPKGKWIAIVGPTGVGKSTIAHLLAGLYQPTQGYVAIDGVPLHTFDLRSWQRQVGYVPQDTIVFNDTVQANIAYGKPDATSAEVHHAAAQAHIHEFFQHLPEGYQTMLGEHGTRLSGGQRQRLAFARALLLKPHVLILDEATASLDAVTEEAIHATLRDTMSTQTILTISHRPSALRHADLIYVLFEGKIVESGTHEALLARGSFYQRLYQPT